MSQEPHSLCGEKMETQEVIDFVSSKKNVERQDGELIDSDEHRAVGGDDTIKAAALQAATEVIDLASDGNVWKRLSCRPFYVNVIEKAEVVENTGDVCRLCHLND